MLSCFLSKKDTEFGQGTFKCHKFAFNTFRVNWLFYINMAIYMIWVDLYLNHITFLYKSMSDKTISYCLFFCNMYFYFVAEQ